MDTFTVRRATTSDVSFLKEMLYLALFVPPGEPPYQRSLLQSPRIAHYYQDFGTQPTDTGRIVVLGSGEPVGAAWVRQFTASNPGYGYVDDNTPELVAAVSKNHRNQALGSTMLQSLLAEVPRCCLSVDCRNPALRMYRRLGFRAMDTHDASIRMLLGGLQTSSGPIRGK